MSSILVRALDSVRIALPDDDLVLEPQEVASLPEALRKFVQPLLGKKLAEIRSFERSVIPSRLRSPEYRFVRVRARGKSPIDKGWQQGRNFKHNDPELVAHLESGGNYGVLCGFGHLAVIDADAPEVAAAVEASLPPTFTVKTGRPGEGGRHYYYKVPDLDAPIRLVKDARADGSVGDIKFTGGQVIGPGSVHPSGNEYLVINDADIATIRKENILAALQDFIRDVRYTYESTTSKGNLGSMRIEDVIDLRSLMRCGSRYQGKCPWHGSETGSNFTVDVEKNVWHCFRHGSGGGPLQAIAVREGIIDCSEARPGGLRGSEFKAAMAAAVEKYGLKIVEPKLKVLSKLPDGTETEVDPSLLVFDSKGNVRGVNHSAVASLLMSRHRFLTLEDTKEILYYDDGVYRQGGECLIEKEAQSMLGDRTTNHVVMEVLGHVRRSTYFKREDLLDLKDSRWRCVANGVLNLDTRELVPHSPDRPYITKLPVRYDPRATTSTRFDAFLDQAMMPSPETEPESEEARESLLALRDRKKDTVYEIFGYALEPGSKRQSIFVLYGKPNTGKTTTLTVMERFLGSENIAAVSFNDLSGFGGGRFKIAELFGTLANLSGELDRTALKSLALIKKLSAGDPIEVERKGERPFWFRNQSKLVFAGNELPLLPADDDGFFKRVVLVEYDNVIPRSKEDHGLVDAMTTSEELSGILNAALDAIARLERQRRFSLSKTVEETREEWRVRSDVIGCFLEDNCEVVLPEVVIDERTGTERRPRPEDCEFILAEELFKECVAYCKRKNVAPVTKWGFKRSVLNAEFCGKRVRYHQMTTGPYRDKKVYLHLRFKDRDRPTQSRF